MRKAYSPYDKYSLFASAAINGCCIVIIKAETYSRRWGKREKYCTLLSANEERALSLVCYQDLTTKQRAFARYRRMLQAIKHLKITINNN